jgi:RNA polymerase sigma factor (sigma-70 family)
MHGFGRSAGGVWDVTEETAAVSENQVFEKRLRDAASRLTTDAEMQKDLMQEMLVHLFQVQKEQPGKTLQWYVKSCEFHARNYLRLGRSIDSYKRARGGVQIADAPNGDHDEFCHEQFFHRVDPVDLNASHKELFRDDILALITPRLSERQRVIMQLLMQGSGVREIGRQLGITHPAVIKHRRKIARIAKEFLDDSLTANRPDPMIAD